MILLHNNTLTQVANLMRQLTKKLGWQLLQYMVYSPDLSLSDYHLLCFLFTISVVLTSSLKNFLNQTVIFYYSISILSESCTPFFCGSWHTQFIQKVTGTDCPEDGAHRLVEKWLAQFVKKVVHRVCQKDGIFLTKG